MGPEDTFSSGRGFCGSPTAWAGGVRAISGYSQFPNRLPGWKGPGATLSPGSELIPCLGTAWGPPCVVLAQVYLFTSRLERCWASQLPGAAASPSCRAGLEGSPTAGTVVTQLLAWA